MMQGIQHCYNHPRQTQLEFTSPLNPAPHHPVQLRLVSCVISIYSPTLSLRDLRSELQTLITVSRLCSLPPLPSCQVNSKFYDCPWHHSTAQISTWSQILHPATAFSRQHQYVGGGTMTASIIVRTGSWIGML